MTEKEKMLKEMLYNANNDEDLLKERTIAKDLCFKFNQLMPSDVDGSFDSCLQFFTNQIAQNVDYINAFEFFYCQIR